jgi:hypothetical protein
VEPLSSTEYPHRLVGLVSLDLDLPFASRYCSSVISRSLRRRSSGPQLKLVCGFREDVVGGLCPHEGLAAVVPAVDEGPDLDHEVSDGGNAPRWMAWRSMMPNHLNQIQP